MKLNQLKGLGWILVLIFYVFLFFFFKDVFGTKYLASVILLLSLISFNLIIYLINRNNDKLKHRLINQTILLLTLLLSIVGIEIYIHVAMPPFLQLQNSVTGELQDFLSQGNFTPSAIHKKAGTFRILGLGDSFAAYSRREGFNYHDVLLKKLQALPGGDKIDLINTGIPRIGPGYYWHTLEKHGDLFQPDLVLVGFYLGNDFYEMRFDDLFIGQYIVMPRRDRAGWTRYGKLRNYWLYQFLNSRLIFIKDNFNRERELDKGQVAEKGTFSRASFLRVEQAKLRLFEKRHQKQLRDLFQRDAGVLLQMKKWCDDRRIELVIAIFPTEIQVAPQMRQEILGDLKLQEEAYDFDYPNVLLKTYLQEHHIRYVDLTPPMREAASRQTLYVLRDTHWNKAGNALAAEIIFAYLQQQGLLQSFGVKP